MSVYNFIDMAGMRLPLGTIVERAAPSVHGAVLWLYKVRLRQVALAAFEQFAAQPAQNA